MIQGTLKDRENLLKAHRRHFYQLLANEMRIAHWKVSIGYGLLQLVVGVAVLLVKQCHGLILSSQFSKGDTKAYRSDPEDP